ncbi:DUF6660 family protein [Spirosoma pomorum]
MKGWLIIWAIYVLALSGVPCEALCRDEPTAVERTSKPTSDDHCHDAACSPFCLCATCPGCTLPQAPQLISPAMPTTLIRESALSPYQAPFAFDVPGRIWQPPRLS